MSLRPWTAPLHTLPHSTPSAPRSSGFRSPLLGASVRPCCAVQNGKTCSPTFGILTVWPLKWGLNHSGDFHFQLFPVVFSDVWYDHGREEISSITQTLQISEFTEITMAIMCLRLGTPPPRAHYPTRRLDPRAFCAFATRSGLFDMALKNLGF